MLSVTLHLAMTQCTECAEQGGGKLEKSDFFRRHHSPIPLGGFPFPVL